MQSEKQKALERVAEIEATTKKLQDETASLRKIIESPEDKTDPLEKFNKVQDIYSHLKVNPEQDVLNIAGFDAEQIKVVKAVIKKMRVCEAYNGRKKLLITDRRYYNWYINRAGSGLVFHNSSYDDGYADLTSASRLSFGKDEHRKDALLKFPELDLDIIDLK